MSESVATLLLPHTRVQNANAISGPLSWGFPAPSAFTGFVHALQRKLNPSFPVTFGGVAIVSHHFSAQESRPPGRWGHTFHLPRHPLRSTGAPPSFVEEGRAHMDVSLLVEVMQSPDADTESFLDAVRERLHAMRLAGGSIVPDFTPRSQPAWFDTYDSAQANAAAFAGYRRRLLPGHALVHRPDLLGARLAELQEAHPDADSLDALLDFTRINQCLVTDPKHPDAIRWEPRPHSGWLVPIPVGYAALSALYPPGAVANTRDPDTPFRFVECLYSLGEWVSPSRVTHPGPLFWRTAEDPEAGIYSCVNDYSNL